VSDLLCSQRNNRCTKTFSEVKKITSVSILVYSKSLSIDGLTLERRQDIPRRKDTAKQMLLLDWHLQILHLHRNAVNVYEICFKRSTAAKP